MYANWNQNLSLIQQALRSGTVHTPQDRSKLQLAARITVSRGRAAEVNAFNVDQTIAFELEVLALPCRYLRPHHVADTVCRLLKHMRRYIIFYASVIVGKRLVLAQYLRELVAAVSADTLLYVYSNLRKAAFETWMRQVKKRTLELAYECAVSRMGICGEVNAWLKHWVSLGIISEDRELRPIIGISLGEAAAVQIKMPSEVEKEKTNPKKKKDSNPLSQVYTGEYSEVCQHYIRRLSAKKEKQVTEYIGTFYELLLQLRDPVRPVQYFESQLDHSSFRKSFIYSMIEYFMMNLKFVDSYFAFATLFDVIRLSSSILTESNRKQLMQIAQKYSGDIDAFKYQSEEILTCFQNSFYGRCLVPLEDEPVLSLAQPNTNIATVPAEELLAAVKQIYEDDVSIYPVEGRVLDLPKANSDIAASGEKIVAWMMDATWKGPDDGKRLRKLALQLAGVGIITVAGFERVKQHVIARLQADFTGTRMITTKEVCASSDLAKNRLPADCTREAIEEFVRKHAETAAVCTKKAGEIARTLFEAQKPAGEAFRGLSGTTKRYSVSVLHRGTD